MVQPLIIPGLLGGLLIGLAAVLLLWSNGRIAGISGILNGAVSPGTVDRAWRWVFLLGLLAGGFAYQWLAGAGLLGEHFTTIAPRTNMPTWLLLLGGLIVGFGTRMGGGCTSGHGVCGMARFSLRSVVATCTFMLVGMLSVALLRHVLGVLP